MGRLVGTRQKRKRMKAKINDFQKLLEPLAALSAAKDIFGSLFLEPAQKNVALAV